MGFAINVAVALILCFLFPAGLCSAAEEAEESQKDMVLVKGGCFKMGCGYWATDCMPNEEPVHEVCLDDFYIDKYEVTQKSYQKVMDFNPSFNRGDDLPVDSITWSEAKEYCQREHKRLPTEAEWEYAARSGGKLHQWSGTNYKDELINYAWYSRYAGGGGGQSHAVGQKLSNGLGIFDMTGNLWEWVSDRYGSEYYEKSPRRNPKGPSLGTLRVARGGSWYYISKMVRNSYRIGVDPDTRNDDFGFRCAKDG